MSKKKAIPTTEPAPKATPKASKSKKKEKPVREKGWFLRAIKKLLPLWITIAALIVLLIVQNGIKGNAGAAEWMSSNVSRYLVTGMGYATSWIPFSLFEWLIVIAILAALILLVKWILRLIKRKGFSVVKGIARVTVLILAIVNFYALTAGYAYERAAPPLPYSAVKYTGEQTQQIAQYFLDDFLSLSEQMERDADGNVVCPYTYRELTEKLQAEFERLDDPYFYQHNVRVKRVVNSWFMTDTHITGIAFMPTGEANINTMVPASDLPHVMAHEMAHTKGVMRENEANLIAYYILLSASDPYLRYCGYFESIGTLSDAVYISNIGASDYKYATEARTAVFGTERLGPIQAEWANAFNFWANYKGPIGFMSDFFKKAGNWFNDLYLKMNGQQDGVGSYRNPSDFYQTDDVDPDTQKPIINYTFSKTQQIYFGIYESIHAD